MKYFLHLFFVLFLLTSSFQAFSQQEKKGKRWYNEASVTLNNGSILKGELITLSNDTVKIVIAGGSVFVYPRSEVQSVDVTNNRIYRKVTSFKYSREGLYYSLLGNVNMNFDDGGVGLSAIVGWQYNNYLAAGVGLGFNQLSLNNGIQTLPLFLDVRGNLSESPISPYYSLGVGYGFALTNDVFDIIRAKGGFMLHPAIGLRFDNRYGSSFLIDFGYQFQNVEITSQRWGGINIDDIQFRRFTARIGWQF